MNLTRQDLILIHTVVNARADKLRQHLNTLQARGRNPDEPYDPNAEAIRRADAMYLRDLQNLASKVDALIDEARCVA